MRSRRHVELDGDRSVASRRTGRGHNIRSTQTIRFVLVHVLSHTTWRKGGGMYHQRVPTHVGPHAVPSIVIRHIQRKNRTSFRENREVLKWRGHSDRLPSGVNDAWVKVVIPCSIRWQLHLLGRHIRFNNRVDKKLIAKHVRVGRDVIVLEDPQVLRLGHHRGERRCASRHRDSAGGQQVRRQLHVCRRKPAIRVHHKRAAWCVELPRPVLLVPAILHQRHERAHLEPPHEQLLGTAQIPWAGAIAANVAAKVSEAVPCGVDDVAHGILQPAKVRVLVTDPA
mmetsp:Transcript_75572/g.152884  ORF Transcript_75572/g.152884 Transcript_75572/m.152884 type:complete len:282 (-) Transcript_75572:107-952(-)